MNFETKNRNVQIYPSMHNLHTAYKSLVLHPPKGYSFTGQKEQTLKLKLWNKLKKYSLMKVLYRIFLKIIGSSALWDFTNRGRILPGGDIIYSIGMAHNFKIPFVIDLVDSPFSVSGYKYNLFVKNKNWLEKYYSSDNCKAIICPHETCLNYMKKNFSENIARKCVLVRTGIDLPKFSAKDKNFRKKNAKILFMGSINNPQDFYVKGGLEAIKAFEKVKNYSDAELIIRCKLPEEIRQIIKKIPQIKTLENEMPFEKVLELYKNSDILLMPSHQFVLMAPLEAMYFFMPVVGIGTYAVKDYVLDRYNGFIVAKSKKITSYNAPDYPTNTRSKVFINEIKNIDYKVINLLAQKIDYLIKNINGRRKMGINAHKFVTTHFSVSARNKMLKKIFDKALKN